MEGRPLPRKMKYDACKTLGERIKNQCDTTEALQDGYKEHEEQPLSVMSHPYRDLFGFVTPPSYESTPSSTDKKCYNLVERGNLTHQCSLALNCIGNPTLAESSKTSLRMSQPCNPKDTQDANVGFRWKLAT
jgi:hypothetical protein